MTRDLEEVIFDELKLQSRLLGGYGGLNYEQKADALRELAAILAMAIRGSEVRR